jgi:tetratricopeptide (TPR) repeat protein
MPLVAVAVGCLFAAVHAPAAERESGLLREYKSENVAYRRADEILNEVKFATSNPQKARARIDQLKQFLGEYPDYPHRYAAYYFLGMNYQLVGEYGKATDALEAALKLNPELADEMALDKRVATLKKRHFAETAPKILIFVVLGLLALGALPMLRKARALVPWRRLIPVYAAALVLWLLAVWLVPVLLGRPDVSGEGYPKPTYVTYRLGQVGDDRLVGLMAYGAGAVAAAFLISVSFAGVRSAAAGRGLSLALIVLTTGSLMALYYVRNWHGQAEVDPSSGQMTVLIKDISRMHEVPDEMLSLYPHERFRKRILEAKKKHAEENE